jgi:hypothetical protein
MILASNIVDAILGREQIKWDALWRLFSYLLDREQPHGLGSLIIDSLHRYAFGNSYPICQIKREMQLSKIQDGKGKWVDLAVGVPSFKSATQVIVMDDVDLRSPGSKRKLANLAEYRERAKSVFPHAAIRLVVLTNADDGSKLAPLLNYLGDELSDCTAMNGWKLLSLRTVGSWVEAALVTASSCPGNIAHLLRDFVEWSASVDMRPVSGSWRAYRD